MEKFTRPVTPSELAFYINKSAKWVREKCKSKEFKTLDLPDGAHYMIPEDEANRILLIDDEDS